MGNSHEDWKERWIIGTPVDNDLDYYRDDEELVNDCLGERYGQSNVVRVLAARRFGKTSFLLRLERWSRRKEERHWDFVRYLDLQRPIGELKKLVREIDGEIDSSTEESEESPHKILILLDEFNALLSNEARLSVVEPLLERVIRGRNEGCLIRLVLVAASNMEDLLAAPTCRLSESICRELASLPANLIEGLTPEEATALMTHAKRTGHEPPEIDDDLRNYAGSHPLFLQYVCHAHFTEDIETYDEFFRDYVSRGTVQESLENIYRDLSSKEKLMLRYLMHYPRASKYDFTQIGGNITLRTLKIFGLVIGHGDNSHSIRSRFLEDYMRRHHDVDPLMDSSHEVRATWKYLFTRPHPSLEAKGNVWDLHQFGNMYIQTSRGAELKNAGKEAALDCEVWKAYRQFLRRSRSAYPRILIAAGDLILNDLRPGSEMQKDGAIDTLFVIDKEFQRVRSKMERIDEGAEQAIIVPGDTDVLIRRAIKGRPYDQYFRHFENAFPSWAEWQFYRDFPMIIAPLDSARLPSAIDRDAGPSSPVKARLDFQKRASSGDEGLLERYDEYRRADFGCLSSDPGELERRLVAAEERLCPKNQDEDDFRHSLKIVVFHHHLEQLTDSQAVDFWDSHKIKTTLASRQFSIVLNAHSLRPFIHSDTVYDNDLNSGWQLHSIGCGSMSKAFVGAAGANPSFNVISITAKLQPPSEENIKYEFTIKVEEVNLVDGVFRNQGNPHQFVVRR